MIIEQTDDHCLIKNIFMAEIHVQAKKKASTMWFWIVLFLLLIGAIVAYVMLRDNKTLQTTEKPTTFLQYEKPMSI